MLWKRPAVMAGKFYPGEKRELLRTIEGLLPRDKILRHPVIGVMVPHAGYIYSGKVAANVLSSVPIPETVVILCPNHTGRGPAISVWSEGVWETPLGSVPVHVQLASQILSAFGLKDGDMLAHLGEHAIEVELPLLQFFQPNLKVVPIVLGFLSFEQCAKMGKALGEVLQKKGKGEVLLIASSDMSHYISSEEARVKDEFALTKFCELSPKGLYDTVEEYEISMCGIIPATVLLQACLCLGAKRSYRLGYSNSGEVTGDNHSVVAYAGVSVEG